MELEFIEWIYVWIFGRPESRIAAGALLALKIGWFFYWLKFKLAQKALAKKNMEEKMDTPMQKAYDVVELGKRLKDAGLSEAEDAGIKTYEVLKQWIKESAKITPMPFDDMGAAYLDQLDAIVLPQLDKIDGQKG